MDANSRIRQDPSVLTSGRLGHALAASLLLAALAGCTSATSSAPPPAPVASPSPSPSATVSAAEAGEQLMRRRAAGPTGSQYAPSNGVVDLDGTVDALLGPAAGPDAKADTKGRLAADGFVVALRHSWTAPDGTRADTLLLRFTAEAGAGSTASRVARNLRSAHAESTFGDPGDLSTGVVVSALDDRGEACVVQVAPHGDAVVLMNYCTPATPDKKTAVLRFTDQLRLLPTPGLPW